MKEKRLAAMQLSKEVPDSVPEEVVDLLWRLLLRVEEPESRLNKHSGKYDKPLSSAHGPCRGLNSARSSLLNSTCLLSRKQSWQCSARAAFCLFPGMAAGGNSPGIWERDAL